MFHIYTGVLERSGCARSGLGREVPRQRERRRRRLVRLARRAAAARGTQTCRGSPSADSPRRGKLGEKTTRLVLWPSQQKIPTARWTSWTGSAPFPGRRGLRGKEACLNYGCCSKTIIHPHLRNASLNHRYFIRTCTPRAQCACPSWRRTRTGGRPSRLSRSY